MDFPISHKKISNKIFEYEDFCKFQIFRVTQSGIVASILFDFVDVKKGMKKNGLEHFTRVAL